MWKWQQHRRIRRRTDARAHYHAHVGTPPCANQVAAVEPTNSTGAPTSRPQPCPQQRHEGECGDLGQLACSTPAFNESRPGFLAFALVIGTLSSIVARSRDRAPKSAQSWALGAPSFMCGVH